MLKFAEYLNNLMEEKAKKEDFGTLAGDPKGKLHELLVGKHLNGGNHMDRHVDIEGKSPKEVHDEITEKLGGEDSEQYRNFNERAKKSAEDIKNQLGLNSDDIAKVQWTSKPGDLKRATGIEATQNQDPSDIVVTNKNGKHHGISLKVSDDNKPITLSNGGTEVTYGGDAIHEKNRKEIKETYPELQSIKNPDKRKEWLRNNPEAKKDINGRNLKVLRDIATNMSDRLNGLTPQQRTDHVRHLVLKAFSTPMEAQGHTHIRHFTGGGFNPVLQTAHPGADHEHILNDPENITAVAQGTSVYFHHKGIPFAMQTAKMSSQSDPLSSLVVTGKDVKRKKDAATAPVAPTKRITSADVQKGINPTIRKSTSKSTPVTPNLEQQRMTDDGGPAPRELYGNDGTHGGAVFRGPTE